MVNLRCDPGSFRDRNSRVFYSAGAVFRGLNQQALREWEALSSTTFFPRLMHEGKLVHTERVDIDNARDAPESGEWAAILKHEPIPFISYPYEWSFGMLKHAALLQLELLLAALNENVILKDASPFNFQWVGTNPIFIDIPSFAQLIPGEPWVGYRQFCQMFLYPLFLQVYKNIPFQPWLRGSIDGIEPQHCLNLMSVRDLLRPGVFMHTYLQSKAQSHFGRTTWDIKKDLHIAGFNHAMIEANVRRLKKIIKKLDWKGAKSTWSDYASTNSYTGSDQEKKTTFIRSVVNSHPWNLVWDLGCNTGYFSRIAAKNSRCVVAMDADAASIERFYQDLRSEGQMRILPLVIDVANPSPNLGWRGMERKAITERGKPDLILCLALIHHVVLSANIPLWDFIDWLASLGANVLIEYVSKEDPMVKELLRNKRETYVDYEFKYFERCLSEAFEVVQRETLSSGTRTLYYGQVKG